MKTYYKVVKLVDDEYISVTYNASSDHIDTRVTYIPYQFVYPNIKGSQLLVFDTLVNAKQFIKAYQSGGIVFTCNVLGPSKSGILMRRCSAINNYLHKICKLKLQHKKYKHIAYMMTPPTGTVFCTAVKLLEEVR